MADSIGNMNARICEECGTALSRNLGEVPSAWARRRFCSVKCARTFGPRKSIDQRLAAKTDRSSGHGPNGDCHMWVASKTIDGYGSIRFDHRTWLAHRLVYHRFVGPVSDSVLVCHSCDNPGCVNPEHLFVGTQQDNMDDMVSKGRQRSLLGSSHTNSKLTEQDVQSIRSDPRPQKVVAAQFGVSRSLISHIKRGRIWKHAEP